MPPVSTDRNLLVLEAARLYYEHHLNQSQIAARLEISRPGVSRMLQEARDNGIVKIQIVDPNATGTRLEAALRDKFGLKQVIVVPSDENDALLKSRMGSALIGLLDPLLSESTTLGVSWGSTLQAATTQLIPRDIKGMRVVQLNGGVSKAEQDTHATEIAGRMGENYSAIPYMLPLPAIVDTSELKQAIISDRHIAKTLKMARESDISVFTIGAFGSRSVLVQTDYFEEAEVSALIQAGAVADICSRLIKADGSICSPELDARTIGIELEELKNKTNTIAIAGGPDKAEAIKAGLAGGYFESLITDETVAKILLDEG